MGSSPMADESEFFVAFGIMCFALMASSSWRIKSARWTQNWIPLPMPTYAFLLTAPLESRQSARRSMIVKRLSRCWPLCRKKMQAVLNGLPSCYEVVQLWRVAGFEEKREESGSAPACEKPIQHFPIPTQRVQVSAPSVDSASSCAPVVIKQC